MSSQPSMDSGFDPQARQKWLTRVLNNVDGRTQQTLSLLADASWVSSLSPIQSDMLERFIFLMPPQPHVLDASCGLASGWKRLKEAGCRMVGLDRSFPLLKTQAKREGRAQFAQALIQGLPLRHSFDGILCMEGVNLLPPEDWPLAVSGFRRSLRPGGWLYINVEIIPVLTLKEMYEASRQRSEPIRFGEWVDEDGYHFYPMNHQVSSWLAEAGLTIRLMKTGDGFMHILAH